MQDGRSWLASTLDFADHLLNRDDCVCRIFTNEQMMDFWTDIVETVKTLDTHHSKYYVHEKFVVLLSLKQI